MFFGSAWFSSYSPHFHGFHVLVGRADAGVHLRHAPDEGPLHACSATSASKGAAWYWHFVDVVWLGLYFLVYWL
jgi:cytochrome c oxidase subunit 3